MPGARDQAGALVNRGVLHLDAGDYAAAMVLFTQAASLDPAFYLPWFNLGLAQKRLRRWQDAADSFAEAYARLPPDLSAERAASVIWNMGITATKLGLWNRAAGTWRLLGHSVGWRPDGSPSAPLGFGWVRRGRLEPAFGTRIDPARIQVLGAANPATGLQPGEIAVHDAERISSKLHQGVNYPVFPEL
jgi:hypothetical protein